MKQFLALLVMALFAFGCGEEGDGSHIYKTWQRSMQTIKSTWEFSANSHDRNRAFGHALAYGDFNNDNNDDLVVSMPLADAAGYEEDAGFVGAYRGYGGTVNDFKPLRRDSEVQACIYPDSADEMHGNSVCTGDFDNDGYDDLAVGAPGWSSDKGKVTIFWGWYNVYDYAPYPMWASITTIQGASSGDQFGWAVACGTVTGTDSYADLVVGAPGTTYGKVYVFAGQSSGINTTAVMSSDGGTTYRESGAELGYALAIVDVNTRSGNARHSVVAGAPKKTVSTRANAGHALVWYGGSPINSTVDEQWYPSSGLQTNGYFGEVLANGGNFINNAPGHKEDEILVGMPRWDYLGRPTNIDQGMVYMVDDGGGGGAVRVSGFLSCYGVCAAYDYFGSSVSESFNSDGDANVEIAVGSRGYGTYDRGRALVYEYYRGSWSMIKAVSGLSNSHDECGWAVAAGNINNDSYDDLSVGCAGAGDTTYLGGNRVINLLGSSSGLVDDDLADVGGPFEAGLGNALVISKNGTDIALVTGSRLADTATYDNCGAVHIVTASSSGGLSIDNYIDQTIYGTADDQYYGHALAIGDFDGDGDQDLAVGAPGYDGGYGTYGEWGRVSVYEWDSGEYPSTPDKTLTAHGTYTEDAFGWVLSTGNVNDDNYDDLLVTAPDEDKVYLYLGSSSGLNSTPAWVRSDSSGGYGRNASIIGDMNGDGYNDWVVTDQQGEGWLYLYFGASTITSSITAADSLYLDEVDAFSDCSTNAYYLGDAIAFYDDKLYIAAARCDIVDASEAYGIVWQMEWFTIGTDHLATSDKVEDSSVWYLGGLTVGYGNLPARMHVGDFDGDGEPDLGVQAIAENEKGAHTSGWLLVWEDVDDYISGLPDYTVRGDYANLYDTFAFGHVEDIDGDGKDDLLTSCPMLHDLAINIPLGGTAILIMGTSTGLAH